MALLVLPADHARPGSILQRLAGKPGEEPIVGLVVSLAIALGAVFLGGLNAVAEVVSMFFLTVYGTVNLVAALETLSGDSTWRPRIRVPWPLSLIGGIACFAVMFLINPIASVAAIAIVIPPLIRVSTVSHPGFSYASLLLPSTPSDVLPRR